MRYNTGQVKAYYYSYQGNQLPLISLCKLFDKSRRLMRPDTLLRVGWLDGFLSGNCGFYVVLENQSK